MNTRDIEKQARWELDIEAFELAVEKRKEELRAYRPWWVRAFPYKVVITRRK